MGISSNNLASGSTGYTRSTVLNPVNSTRVNRKSTGFGKERAQINHLTGIEKTYF
jgi:hypothetical protein